MSELWDIAKPVLTATGSNLTYLDFEQAVQPMMTIFAAAEEAANRSTSFALSSMKPPVPSMPRLTPTPPPQYGDNCDGVGGSSEVPPSPMGPPPPGVFLRIPDTPATGMMQSMSSGVSSGGSANSMLMASAMGTVGSIAADVIPQGVPPPVWNMRPLPCMPMVTGLNCRGAINYPITFSDFILADQTDAQLSDVIASFPDLFAMRTMGAVLPWSIYISCFQAYMSMYCASVFMTCTSPQSSQWMMPIIGKMPICYTLCIKVLMTCPGFTFEDVRGPCATPSIPPICALADYKRTDAIPPPAGVEIPGKGCPPSDPNQDISKDPSLYQPLLPENGFWGETGGPGERVERTIP